MRELFDGDQTDQFGVGNDKPRPPTEELAIDTGEDVHVSVKARNI